jgi:hypothetical protein
MESIPFEEEWIAITRLAQLPQRPQIEHLGLIWIDPPPKEA